MIVVQFMYCKRSGLRDCRTETGEPLGTQGFGLMHRYVKKWVEQKREEETVLVLLDELDGHIFSSGVL